MEWIYLDFSFAIELFFRSTISSTIIRKSGDFVDPLLLKALELKTMSLCESSRISTSLIWEQILIINWNRKPSASPYWSATYCAIISRSSFVTGGQSDSITSGGSSWKKSETRRSRSDTSELSSVNMNRLRVELFFNHADNFFPIVLLHRP
jgi:hypothetical protein